MTAKNENAADGALHLDAKDINAGPEMAILAIDLGTVIGWALRTRENATASGFARFANARFEGGGMRFLKFRQWLERFHHSAGHIDAVFFEEVRRHLGVDAAHIYGGFLAHLTAYCEAHSIPYRGVPVGTIKKHATGKGNASKGEMIDAVRRLGYNPSDDNEADAIAILRWAIDEG